MRERPSGWAPRRRAASYMAMGKYKKALTDYKSLKQLKPNDKDVHEKFKACEKEARAPPPARPNRPPPPSPPSPPIAAAATPRQRVPPPLAWMGKGP